jgi:hypothetical protein
VYNRPRGSLTSSLPEPCALQTNWHTVGARQSPRATCIGQPVKCKMRGIRMENTIDLSAFDIVISEYQADENPELGLVLDCQCSE